MSRQWLRFFLWLVLLAVVSGSGCGRLGKFFKKEQVKPEIGDYMASGIRYAPQDTLMPDGIAQLFAVDRAAGLARKQLRQKLQQNPDLVGLPVDSFELTIRDDYMRAKLDELIRTESEIIYTEYSQEERRAETIVELVDPELFRQKYLDAYNRRVVLLQ